MLIQIDKLVQLLESPVFTYLRMQLLEPERFPYLYKCLYGLLMLLPQSSAFAALKNRLNSVSAIGYLHIAPRGPPTTPSGVSTFERQNRLRNTTATGKDGDAAGIRWNELLDKFRQTQDRVRKSQLRQLTGQFDDAAATATAAVPSQQNRDRSSSPELTRRKPPHAPALTLPLRESRPSSAQSFGRPNPANQPSGMGGGGSTGTGSAGAGGAGGGHAKGKSSLSHLGRFTSGVGGGVRKGKK
ncbi:hypothetical protein KC319_g10601 [Hortaea werneckii]|nr:hypothetical protein KC317_g11012 [Hortaea werneckii]KAI7653064.1 hypothetical protein KC319_g10601 [Hortaea werneckii]KAI7693366.1 hypothetical protein KC322_g10777 [Hortaea werneckii]